MWINKCASGKSGSFFSLLTDLFLTEASNYLCVDLVLHRLISRGITEIGNESLNVMCNFEWHGKLLMNCHSLCSDAVSTA